MVRNIGQLITMAGPVPRRGGQMKDIGLIENGGVAIAGEEILAVGKSDEVEGRAPLAEGCAVVDVAGAAVTPGLIDPHTHPVFSMTREKEFEMRTQGKSYMEIAQSGGGIRASVRDLRTSSTDVLMKKTKERLDRMMRHGITTIEAKSGYGLSTESEVKQLKIVRDLNLMHPIDLVPTFLGAHEVPDEYRNKRNQYVDLIINEMIPAVVDDNLAEFSDVFCEEGVFDIEESKKIQQAASRAGLKLKFHADELKSTGGAELAASLQAVSADHLVYISDAGVQAMARSGSVAVLLPGTTFSLGGNKYAPARSLIEAGAVIALSTDCNPGSSYTESLPFILSLAALQMKLTAAEALCAVTVNAACAIDRAGKIGLLKEGLPGDLVVWDVSDYRELPYHYAVNLIKKVVKRGKLVVNN